VAKVNRTASGSPVAGPDRNSGPSGEEGVARRSHRRMSSIWIGYIIVDNPTFYVSDRSLLDWSALLHQEMIPKQACPNVQFRVKTNVYV